MNMPMGNPTKKNRNDSSVLQLFQSLYLVFLLYPLHVPHLFLVVIRPRRTSVMIKTLRLGWRH